MIDERYPVWKNPGVQNEFLLGMETELDSKFFHSNLMATIVDLRNLWIMFPNSPEERSVEKNCTV